MSNNVKIVRLSSSEIVLGTVDENGDVCKAFNLLISVGPSQDAKAQNVGIKMAPILHPIHQGYLKEKISREHVVYTVDPPMDLINAYMEQVSGLVVPSTGDIQKVNFRK